MLSDPERVTSMSTLYSKEEKSKDLAYLLSKAFYPNNIDRNLDEIETLRKPSPSEIKEAADINSRLPMI